MQSVLRVSDLQRLHDGLWSAGEQAIMEGISKGTILLLSDELVTPEMKRIIEERFLKEFGEKVPA